MVMISLSLNDSYSMSRANIHNGGGGERFSISFRRVGCCNIGLDDACAAAAAFGLLLLLGIIGAGIGSMDCGWFVFDER